MKKINRTILVEASKHEEYQISLQAAIDEMQALNLDVEVHHAMCQSNKGIGYLYSAIVVGRGA